MTMTDDRELSALSDDREFIRQALYTANENGLLKNQRVEYESIAEAISLASDARYKVPPDRKTANKKLSEAYFLFNQAINKESFGWRLIYQHGAGVLAYLVLVLIGIFMAWFLRSPEILDLEVLWVPSWAFLWGAMGGVLYGFWILWHFVAYGELRKYFFVRFFSLPLMGGILGALVYLIFFAGFIAVTGGAQTASESFIMLLCALAGFSSKWAIDILNNITDMIKVGAEKTGAL